jgi:hypothetical protein
MVSISPRLVSGPAILFYLFLQNIFNASGVAKNPEQA